MKLMRTSLILLLLHLFPLQVSAVINSDADIVSLKQDCTGIDNCFTSLSAIDTWIDDTRHPDASDPVTVHIAPGTYPGLLTCSGSEHISLIGSGRNITRLQVIQGSNLSVIVLKDDCNINVQNLLIDGVGGLAAIQVRDQPDSTFNIHSVWDNVEIIATGYTWVEEHCDPSITDSKHFWIGSKLTAVVGGDLAPFAKTYASCAENWFHASEITAIKDQPTNFPQTTGLIALGETHVYGGVIRVITGEGVSGNESPTPAPHPGAGPQGQVAIYASGEHANVHVHGAGIDVLSAEANDIAGIFLENSGRVHVMESTFNMSSCDNTAACGGTLQRIVNLGGTVRSAFQWESGTEPPNIDSLDGYDTFIETDCSASGCQTAGSYPHMLIYTSACNSGWFDTVTGSCR